MLNDFEIEKVKRFANDTLMSQTIYNLIREAFLTRKGQKDVQVLAAERLALDFLSDAWKEIIKFKNEPVTNKAVDKQIGM